MQVGDRVEKKAGYQYPGIIVSVFKTTAGNTRFVVESTVEECKGMLHIYNAKQLVKVEP